jgi:hypothetical protein
MSEPSKPAYRQRPLEAEALQWTGTNADELRAFAGTDFDTIDPQDRIEDPDQDAQLLVEASHWVGIGPGDWVLRFEGYFVAKSDAAFRAVWEPAVSSPAPADRAALIREVIERLETRARQAPAPAARLHSFRDVARVLVAELHDMAGEARDERETQAAQPKRPPMDPVHILGIGAPAAVAQRPQEADGDRIVAYQSPGGTALFCTRHRDELSPYWPPVFSEDLPDGGICAHSTCGADVLIPQQPEAAEGAQR